MRAIVAVLFLYSSVVQAQVSVKNFEAITAEFVSYIVPYEMSAGGEPTQGITLVNDPSVRAWAENPIKVTTGFIENTYLDNDGLVLTLCHEVGHDIKVAFAYTPKDARYAFTHLLQDYYASYSCFLPFLKISQTLKDQNLPPEKLKRIPKDLQAQCEEFYPNQVETQLCLRGLHAALTTIELLYYSIFKSEYDKAGLPAPSLEREWLNEKDDLQARLITFVNGFFKEPPFFVEGYYDGK